MPTKSKNNPGFTIVELIVAISVFAILVPAVSSFLNLLSAINDRARDTAVINALVEHKIETLRSISFVGVNDGTVDFTAELPSTIADPATRSAEYTVTSLSTSLKQIDVDVSYVDHGQTRTLEYRTYLGELGVGQY